MLLATFCTFGDPQAKCVAKLNRGLPLRFCDNIPLQLRIGLRVGLLILRVANASAGRRELPNEVGFFWGVLNSRLRFCTRSIAAYGRSRRSKEIYERSLFAEAGAVGAVAHIGHWALERS
jgi:hypothetical protein